MLVNELLIPRAIAKYPLGGLHDGIDGISALCMPVLHLHCAAAVSFSANREFA